MFWFLIFGLLAFLCFTLVFPIRRNSSKIGFGKKKTAFAPVFTVFFKVCACRRGGDQNIYVYIYTWLHKIFLGAKSDTQLWELRAFGALVSSALFYGKPPCNKAQTS